MIADRVRKVLADVFGIDPSDIRDDASPGTIEKWDSLRHMNLVLALEDEFDIRFPDDQIEQLIGLRLIEICVEGLIS